MQTIRLASFAFIVAVALAANAFAAAPAVGDLAKDVVPEKSWNANGRERLSDFRGEYALVVTWATW